MSFQRIGKIQGDNFEEQAQIALSAVGFEIAGIHVDILAAGVDVDIIANNQHGVSFYVTCKGSLQGERPGCIRTDTLKKAIAEAYCLHAVGLWPILFLTSHLPEDGRGIAMLNLALSDPAMLFDALVPSQDRKRIKWLAGATEEALRSDILARTKQQYKG